MGPVAPSRLNPDADPHGRSAPAEAGGPRPLLRWLASACGGTLAFVAVLALAFRLTFGSVADGLHWLRGEPLALRAATLILPPAKPGEQRELAFEVTNLSFRPVHILGGVADCKCVKIGGLPAVVPARGAARIPVTVVARPDESGPATFRQAIAFYTDLATQVRLNGSIEGQILPGAGPAGSPAPAP